MQHFKSILCVVDNGSRDNATLEQAAKLAENHQASLTVIEVIDQIPAYAELSVNFLSSEKLQAKIVGAHQKRLEELVAPWSKRVKIKPVVLAGIFFITVIREVLDNEHDLVLKTVESGGLVNRLFGSNDMHLLRNCPCPVWLIKPTSAQTCQRILAAVDVSDNYPPDELKIRSLLNNDILEIAGTLALAGSSELHIIDVWNAIGESALRSGFIARPEEEVVAYVKGVEQQHAQNLDVLVEKVFDRLGQDALEYIKPEKHLVKGYPRKKVPELTEKIKADLVVMGTVARTGIPGFFIGNTAENILNQLDCSVLAIKPPGFVTPVTLEK
jgi:nucleotide-binding universal stress UspA family protein